jgi:hypothetical protein
MQRNTAAVPHMERKEIRLQYSGFVIFMSKLLNVATGLIFQLMLGHAIAADSPEYGIWANINDILLWFTLLAAVVPFWVLRCVSRGKQGAAKTGFMTNLLIAGISTAAYLAFIPFILSALGISADYLTLYLVVSVQIVELYVMSVFEYSLQACTPQKVGYGAMIQQVIKVAMGYVLIVQFGQPLMGAVVSISVAVAVQVGYYYALLAEELKQRIQWGYVKDWLKASAANIYYVVGSQLTNLVFIMLFYYGEAGGREIYYAAATMANVITFSGFLAFALYPKLLAEKRSEDITSALKMVLMFAIPMTVGAIALSNSYIVLIRTNLVDLYPGAGLVLVVLALDAFVAVVAGVYGSVLFGFETVDQEKMSFRALVKSKLFLYFSLPFVQSAVAIPTVFYVLTTYAFGKPLEAAFAVCVINFAVRFAVFIVLIALVRGMIKIAIPWRSVLKYVFASTVMGAVLFLLPYSGRISTTLAWTALGSVVYLAILLAIDKEARALPKSILQEIRGKKSLAT